MRDVLKYLKYIIGAGLGTFLIGTGLELVDVTNAPVGWTFMVLGLVVMVGSSIQGYRAWRKSRGADGSNDQIEQQPKRPHDIEREGLTELQRVRYMDIILNATPTHEGHIDYVRQQVYEALMANRSVLEDCGFCHKPILGDE